jgi:4-amino-4-deoxy-L-arabinose transferase-like glycosyltransferase
MSASSPMMSRLTTGRSSWPLWAAFAVLALAALMRFSGLHANPFWSDEAWNLWAVRDGFPVMLERLAANHHPPLYFLTLQVWIDLVGDSKLAMRFIALCAGLLSTAVIIRAGREIFGGWAGLAAGALFAVAEQTVYYGQSVRHYAFVIPAAALTLWMLARFLRYPSWPRALAYGLSVALVAYTAYLGLIAVAIQGVAGVFLWRAPIRQRMMLVGAYAFAFALFAPWLVMALPGAIRKVENGAITGYINSIPTNGNGLIAMLGIVLGGQAAVGLALSAYAVTERRPRLMQAIVAACGLGGLALMAVINLRLGIISERTLSFLVPAALLTIGAGLARVPGRFGALLLIAMVGWAILTPQGIIPRLNTDLVAQTIAETSASGDLIVLETGFDDAAFAYELRHTLPDDQRVFMTFSEYDYPGDAELLAALDVEIAASHRVWLVYWNIPQRMADRLSAAGFSRLSRTDLPVGADDPLYVIDPTVRVFLYARPDLSQSAQDFGGALTLISAEVPERAQPGAELPVTLWLQPGDALNRDYSIGVFLQNAAGETVAQAIAPQTPPTTWPTDRATADVATLALPTDLPTGDYTVRLVVYWYGTPDTPLTLPDGQPYYDAGRVTVIAPG